MINSLIGSVIGGLLLIALPVQASPKLRVGVYVSPPYVIENQVLTVHDIWLFVTCYGSIGWHKSTKSLSGKTFN